MFEFNLVLLFWAGVNWVFDQLYERPFFAQTVCTQPFHATLCTCVVPLGICLSKFFENTRDEGHRNPTLTPRAFQKISDSNAQWFPLDTLR